MFKLWAMMIGVMPLGMVMQYGLKMAMSSMVIVYALYFMVFVVMINRTKKNRKV
ncbi:MAG: hypothetical protein WC455_07280 [Dehalococcoidia bacterium]|jgi:choline-glycine betaine transporter